MDRDTFKSMDIENQIQFVNDKLKEYDSFNKLCKGEGLAKSSVSENFKKHGYKFIDGQYRLIDSPVEAHTQLDVTNVHNDVASHEEENNSDILGMIQALQKEVSTLRGEVNKLKSPVKSKVKDIELMSFTGDTANRSFRIDSNVLKDFNTFCKKNKKYKKQDLLSQALQEFINKYK